MMQRNVFFKVRLLIPLCLWCVRFRHNNHLVRKKTSFGLKYQIVMDFLSKISSFWRHELVWKLSSVRLQMLSWGLELQTLYLSHHPLRLLIQTGLFFFNISTSNSGFLCMQIEKCAEIQVDGNVPIQTVPWTEQLRSGWITQSCHYFVTTSRWPFEMSHVSSTCNRNVSPFCCPRVVY